MTCSNAASTASPKLISEASRGEHGRAKAAAYVAAAEASVQLYGDTDAVAFDVLADELTEIALLEAAEVARRPLERRREALYRQVDPHQIARSLPGIARVGAPVAVAFTGRAKRFANGDRYASYCGLVPRASETGDTDKKGQPITKAGNRKLRRMFVRAADTARKLDPQLARIYYVQIVERGAHHTKALCVVGSHLARRFRAVMARGEPYVMRDVDGIPVSRTEAKAIVAERYTVPEEVRARRRSKKKAEEGPSPSPRGTCVSSQPSRGDTIEATHLRGSIFAAPKRGGQSGFLKSP